MPIAVLQHEDEFAFRQDGGGQGCAVPRLREGQGALYGNAALEPDLQSLESIRIRQR